MNAIEYYELAKQSLFAFRYTLSSLWMSRRGGQTTLLAPSASESLAAQGQRSETTGWHQVSRALYLLQELMGVAEGTGLLWLAGMANGVRYFAPPYWKIEQAAKRAAKNPYYER